MSKEDKLARNLLDEVQDFMIGFLRLNKNKMMRDFDFESFFTEFCYALTKRNANYFGESDDLDSLLKNLSAKRLRMTKSGLNKQLNFIQFIATSLLLGVAHEIYEHDLAKPENIKVCIYGIIEEIGTLFNKKFDLLTSSTTGAKNEEEQTSKD